MTVTLAGAWYESANFWAATTAIVTALGIASTTWARCAPAIRSVRRSVMAWATPVFSPPTALLRMELSK